MVFHRVPWVYQKNVVSHQEVPWFIWSYCFVPKPTKHHFLFSHDADHRPSNTGISSFHPNFLEKCPVGFRTTDSVVGDAIWQSRTHWICDIALWIFPISMTMCVVWSRKLLLLPNSRPLTFSGCGSNLLLMAQQKNLMLLGPTSLHPCW